MIYLTLFLEFFKIGLFCFGGAFGMIPIIEETVVKHSWLTSNDFYNLVGVCESTPGPIAVNMATYIGSVKGGILGSLVATLGVVLPSFIIILLVASVLNKFTDNRHFKSFMQGVKPMIIALILSTGIMLLIKAIGFISISQFNIDYEAIIILFIIGLVYFIPKYLFNKKISSAVFIVISAVIGIAVSIISNLILVV